MSRYTREQILCGLRAILAMGGAPPVGDDEPFDCDALDEFWLDLNEIFGPVLTTDDGTALAEIAVPVLSRWGRMKHFYTLNRLAEFLESRLVAPSFGPADIAGTRCDKAGAFLGVREIVSSIDESVSRFAPSTPIRGHLKRGELARLWMRLRWISLDRLPPLKTTWVDRALWLFVLSIVGLVGSGVAAVLFGVGALLLHGLSACKLSWAVFRLAERLENPLPDGIVTFGDLARRLAEVRVSAAR